MSELTLTVLRLGLLAMLWVFVFSVVGVLRSDLYGTRVVQRRGRTKRQAERAAALAAAQAGPGGAPGPGGPGTPAPGQPGHLGQSGTAGGAGPAPAPPRSRGWGGRNTPRTLAVTEGRLAGTSLPLTGSAILVGRNPECGLVLDDDFASGRHARLHQQGGQWVVEDLGSTNGTYLDGTKLTVPRPVGIGSTIRIGRTVLELQG